MVLADILRDPPKPHLNPVDGQFVLMGLQPGPLAFITEHATHDSVTLETGCGISTVAFALTGSKHWTISPAAHEFKCVIDYCRSRGIGTGQITMVESCSEVALPTLRTPPLDLVLIDGRHGFPTPFIDWYYTARRLKIGGYLIVDDTWLWTGDVLCDFLRGQPQWQFIGEYEYRTAIFKKLADGDEVVEWTEQPFVARNGRMKWIDGKAHYAAPKPPLRARDIPTKIARRLRRLLR